MYDYTQTPLAFNMLMWGSLRLAPIIASLPSSLSSKMRGGGEREPGTICGKSCQLLARHHSCDQRRIGYNDLGNNYRFTVKFEATYYW